MERMERMGVDRQLCQVYKKYEEKGSEAMGHPQNGIIFFEHFTSSLGGQDFLIDITSE